MKILLVDDDVFLRDMYAVKFRESGDEVTTAHDGTEALRLLASGTYDVVITDMVMPGMTGAELIKKIKATDLGKDMKCIVLSNQGEEQDISAAKTEGAIGYIIKAESIPSEVVTRVHAIIS
jgi:DNA-binding response OmpR family regulator